MNIGIVGLGKLGLPVAVAMAHRGHTVRGYDLDPKLMTYRQYEHRELGPNGRDDFQTTFKSVANRSLCFVPLEDVIADSEIVFLAIQTPHHPDFEGVTKLPKFRSDFGYTYLEDACRSIASLVRPEQTVAIISTVLPGTIRSRIIPLIGDKCHLVYNPFFIAMGTVIRDFLKPEFILLGSDQPPLPAFLAFYYDLLRPVRGQLGIGSGPLFSEPVIRSVSIESAELTKVAYNTFISMKIAYANTLMEIAHKSPGCNVDEVIETIGFATDRIISPAYLKGGMGDGGGCHPRDNIAMSWLANSLHLSHNLFDDIMMAREHQTEWLAKVIEDHSHDRSVVILGKAFKPETNIVTGSPAMLLANLLDGRRFHFYHYDPFVDQHTLDIPPVNPLTFFIATKHRVFAEQDYPPGSIIIDPFRYIPDRPGVKVIPLGIGR